METDKPKVSVIIPVYNVEEYLRECLDSIINQTLKDLEIICINDGSTDNSLEILKEYASKDNRIKIIDKKNEGAGKSRNIGLKSATGETVIFFDSDDYMELDALELLYSKIKQDDSDICIGGFSKLNQSTGTISKEYYNINPQYIFNNVNSISPCDINDVIYQSFVGWPWDKLYKHSFIKKYHLKFQILRQSNDTRFVLLSLILADKISLEKTLLFTHRYRQNSLEATRKKQPECFYHAMKSLYRLLKHYNKYKTYEKTYLNYAITFPFWHVSTMDDYSCKDIMKQYHVKLLKDIKFEKYSNPEYFYDNNAYIQVLKYYNDTLEKEKIHRKEMLERLFSIKNIGTHKVICLFGLKLKIKLQKLVERESVNYQEVIDAKS